MNQPILAIERIAVLIQFEIVLFILSLSLVVLGVYKFFLKNVTLERHRNIRELFLNLSFHILIGITLFAIYSIVNPITSKPVFLEKLTPFISVLVVASWCVIFIKVVRIAVFEYLFLGHMQEGVPIFVVNLSTLLLSILLLGWITTDVLGMRLAPFLATSAILSVILGLALQDTLGNLFAGIALQIDKPYEIGDWIEINYNSGEKWVGQVNEVTWRATILIGFTEEYITVANRIMAQSQISNFSIRNVPIVRRQIFKISHGAKTELVKYCLARAARETRGVCQRPEPIVLLDELHENWMAYKLVYYIDDYGSQYLISDRILMAAIELLTENNISVASQRVNVSVQKLQNEENAS